MTVPSAKDALLRLKEGNARFVARARGEANVADSGPLVLPQVQEPMAIVLGCSDARVPAEMVFDQGPGELFVVRVAGNIIAPSQMGSVEFAAGKFGTRLVVVLGHSRCGAVQATLDALRDREHPPTSSLQAIVNLVRPAVEPVLVAGDKDDGNDNEIMTAAVRANVRHSVQMLREGSAVIDQLCGDDGLLIVGAEYDLETGLVTFLED